jgi:hypothetical protein
MQCDATDDPFETALDPDHREKIRSLPAIVPSTASLLAKRRTSNSLQTQRRLRRECRLTVSQPDAAFDGRRHDSASNLIIVEGIQLSDLKSHAVRGCRAGRPSCGRTAAIMPLALDFEPKQ